MCPLLLCINRCAIIRCMHCWYQWIKSIVWGSKECLPLETGRDPIRSTDPCEENISTKSRHLPALLWSDRKSRETRASCPLKPLPPKFNLRHLSLLLVFLDLINEGLALQPIKVLFKSRTIKKELAVCASIKQKTHTPAYIGLSFQWTSSKTKP